MIVGIVYVDFIMLVGASQKNPFWHFKNEKWFFYVKKMKTFFGNIIIHSKMHACVQYGHIWTNYVRFLLNRQKFFFLGKIVFFTWGVNDFFV